MLDSIQRRCRPIQLEDRPKIDEIRAKAGHTLSSHAFPSLYVWQKEMKLSLYLQDDYYSVKIDSRGNNAWFFPCGDPAGIGQFIRNGMDTPGFSLAYLRNCDAQWLQEQFPGKWEIHREECSDEYVCKISDYLEMEGSQYSDVRKKLRHLEREFQVESRLLSEDTMEDAYEVVRQWRNVQHHVSAEHLEDSGVSEIALRERKALSVTGSILYVNQKPAALYAGFPIDGRTMDVLVGKCVPNAPNYTVYLAMREFLRQNKGDYVYCNLEEDLGIPGIRMVKQKMRPILKHEIWEAVRA